MKKNFAKVFVLLFALLLTVALVGCNNGTKFSYKDDYVIPVDGFDTTTDVEITFEHTMGATLQPVLEQALASFKVLYPNITVVSNSIGGYDEVKTDVSNKIYVTNAPDIAYCYPDHVALYNKTKAVVKLDQLINDETYGFTQDQIDEFIPSYYGEGDDFEDGAMYTLPFSKSTEVLYYNKTFFEENNLTVPTTWAEMAATCAAIKVIDPKSVPLGIDSGANVFIEYLEQAGAPYTSATEPHFLFDNDTSESMLAMFKDWYNKGYVTTQGLFGTYTSALFVTIPETDTDISSYMSIGSSAGATHQCPEKINNEYPFEVGITSIPQVDPENPKVISQGPSVCIFKQSNPQRVLASWLLVKYLTTDVAFQGSFSKESGYVPVVTTVNNNESYSTWLDSADGNAHLAALSVKVCLDQADAYFTSPAFVGSSVARTEVDSLFDAVISGVKTYEQAMEDALAECEYQAV